MDSWNLAAPKASRVLGPVLLSCEVMSPGAGTGHPDSCPVQQDSQEGRASPSQPTQLQAAAPANVSEWEGGNVSGGADFTRGVCKRPLMANSVFMGI